MMHQTTIPVKWPEIVCLIPLSYVAIYRFPVICMMDDKQTPIFLKVAAYYLATHFNIGVVRKADVPAMRKAFKQVPVPKVGI